MFLIAIFTRYNSLLAITPILIIIFSKKRILGDLKQIFIGIVAFLFALIPFFVFYTNIFKDPLFPFAAAFAQVEYLRESATTPYQDALWYVKLLYDNFFNPNRILLILFFFSLLLGLSIYVYRLIKENIVSYKKYIIFVFFLVIYLSLFNSAGLIFRQIILLALSFSLFSLIKNSEYAWLDCAVFAWFVSYLDYNSHIMFRLERYQIPMFFPISYLVVLSLSTISTAYRSLNIKSIRFLIKAIVCIIALGIALQSYYFGFSKVSKSEDKLVVDIKKAASWLRTTEKNIDNKVVYSDVWPAISWYMKTDVTPSPAYKNVKSYEHELLENDADYFITIRNRNLNYYDLTEKIGQVKIYSKKINAKFPKKPRVLFIGQKWNRYIDEVLDYKYFVMDEIDYATGNYAFGKSLYIDNYTVKELQNYPVVLAYNFKWKDRLKAEKTIINYASSGGNVILDASGNVSTYHYNLNNSSFLNILVERKHITTPSYINFMDNDSIGYKSNDKFQFDEIWTGMTYRPINKTIDVDVFAEINKNPIIMRQKIGKGNVYWIGYNLVWHSYLYNSKVERKAINNMLDLAYSSSLLLKK